MSNGWEQDKRWSDRFLHEIKGHIGQALIMEPEISEDQERNTDLIVLEFQSVRIACRVRSNSYLNDRYKNEFTIRAKRPSGNLTELQKIGQGWGDYIFYGFSDAEEKKLARWFIGDLEAFRKWWIKYFETEGEPPGTLKINYDGSSAFRVYDRTEIPDFVIAKGHHINTEQRSLVKPG